MPLVPGTAGDYPTIYSTLLTTTIQAYRRTLVDVISDAIPFWWWINQGERKKMQAGGESILQPLMQTLNPVQRFSGLDKLETTTKEGISPAVFLWKHYHTSVVIPMIHLRHNIGEAAILNLLEAEMEQARISFRDALNVDSVNNDLNAAGDPKGIEGLATIISDADNAVIYGGIDDSANAFWKPQGGSTNGTIANDFSANGIQIMREVYFDCTRGNDKPDLFLCTQAFYENYDRALFDQKRFVNTNAADAGFENLAFHGATVMFDRDVPANRCFVINSNYMNLIVDPEVEFHADDFFQSENVWAMISRIFWRGNLTCSNRARQGLIVNGDTF